MKKKIEFIKETQIDGHVYYYTQVNGTVAAGSCKMDESKARELYNNIVKNEGEPAVEVLETIEIDAA